MAFSRLQVSHQYGEVYPNVFDDFDWVHEHRQELLKTYGECVILVYKHQVIGKGQTLQNAIEDAEQHLPTEPDTITPITEYLRYPRPFLRIIPTVTPSENQ